MKKFLFILCLFLSTILSAQTIDFKKFDNKKMCYVMFNGLQSHTKQLLLVKSSTNDYFEIRDTISCENIITYQEISKKYINKWTNENDVNFISMILLKDFACKINIKSQYKRKNKIHIITCLFTYN